MNRVPIRRASVPISGQPPTSRLASSVAGSTASTATMSSQETWLATMSVPTPFGPLTLSGPGAASSRTPSAASTPRAWARSVSNSASRSPLATPRVSS